MATIKDVAAEAGVSIATVSKILNDSQYSSGKSRTKVMAAIKKLGYQPNHIARSMVRGKTKLIALVVPDIRNDFFTQVARGVEDIANKYDYRVILCNTDEDPGKQSKYLEMLRGGIVDGFIIAPADDDDALIKKVEPGRLPFVFIDRVCSGVQADAVVVDNRDGSYRAVQHLLDNGYRRIGFIAGKRDIFTGRERWRGYQQALGDYEIALDDQLIKDGRFTIEGGYLAMKALLALEQRPEAVFVSNYSMTIGALKAMTELRLKIPQEIAVVGFDDSDWAEFFVPPLTVIRQPTYTMGTLAGEILFQRLFESETSERKEIFLRPELVIRKSCGAR
jgi:DNA-binding LacI/PurR family transcriptional regulator